MQAKLVAKTSLRPGHVTTLGIVKEIRLSPSGKTIVITVTKADGTEFTDRLSSTGNISIFS